MKRIKMILALMIAMVIICVSVLTAFAKDMDEEVNVYTLADDLQEYTAEYLRTFRLEFEQTPGSLPLNCCLDSASELLAVCEEVENFYLEVIDTRVPTVEEINSYYRRLDEAAKKVILYRGELKYLIDHCGYETNDDSYYPQDIWEHFQDCLERAVDVYTKEIRGIEVSQVYWDLKFAYNELCVVNTVSGDLDNSGKLSIFDVTLVQMNLVQMCSFNSSQLTILNESSEDNITIMDATKLQLAIAELDEFSSYNLVALSADTNRMCLNDNRVFRSYRYTNYQGGIVASTCD